MKLSKVVSICLFLCCGLFLFYGVSNAIPLDPVEVGRFQTLNSDDNTEYGPPAPAVFADGPITLWGEEADIYAGPNPARRGEVSSLLFVLSAESNSFIGSVDFQLVLFGISYEASVNAGDFFSHASTGFPSNIPGIGHGEVNFIVFPDAYHAAIEVDWDPLDSIHEGDLIGGLTIFSPELLRVDIFGVAGGNSYIYSNTPNSHALGIAEPATMLLLGTGLIGMALIGRTKFRKVNKNS